MLPHGCQVVSQAQMALWAHGLDHGIVVNIGQQQTIAMPVLRGAGDGWGWGEDMDDMDVEWFQTMEK